MGISYCVDARFAKALPSKDLCLSLEDALVDMQTSCDVAVHTLNDILAYDKLEAGDMKLERERASVQRIVFESVKPFEMQVILHRFLSDRFIVELK